MRVMSNRWWEAGTFQWLEMENRRAGGSGDRQRIRGCLVGGWSETDDQWLELRQKSGATACFLASDMICVWWLLAFKWKSAAFPDVHYLYQRVDVTSRSTHTSPALYFLCSVKAEVTSHKTTQVLQISNGFGLFPLSCTDTRWLRVSRLDFESLSSQSI